MKEVLPLWSKEDVDNAFNNPRLFELMKPFDGAIEVLKRLKEQGHYLEICSCHTIGEGSNAKEEFIKKKMPFIDKITIIPIDNGLQKFDKSSAKGDIVIDDKLDALISCSCPVKILYGEYSWNRDFDENSIQEWTRNKVSWWKREQKVIEICNERKWLKFPYKGLHIK
jgi:5'(3')-deoxyribonucleotidase